MSYHFMNGYPACKALLLSNFFCKDPAGLTIYGYTVANKTAIRKVFHSIHFPLLAHNRFLVGWKYRFKSNC